MKNRRRWVRKRRISLPQKINMIRNQEMDMCVTFLMPDGSRITESLNEKFLGKKKVGQIITDLYAISHDKGAVKFII
jgi:hypothetical protein